MLLRIEKSGTAYQGGQKVGAHIHGTCFDFEDNAALFGLVKINADIALEVVEDTLCLRPARGINSKADSGLLWIDHPIGTA